MLHFHSHSSIVINISTKGIKAINKNNIALIFYSKEEFKDGNIKYIVPTCTHTSQHTENAFGFTIIGKKNQ